MPDLSGTKLVAFRRTEVQRATVTYHVVVPADWRMNDPDGDYDELVAENASSYEEDHVETIDAGPWEVLP